MSRPLFKNRSKKINYDRLGELCFIGCYERQLPVSMTRMMENAYDWAHLPHVHASSFRKIDLVDEGDWGWRAIATLPNSKPQYLELLVDKPKGYWATTVLSGNAKGFEIHTQATPISDRTIEVAIKFYLPKTFSKILLGLSLAKKCLPFFLYSAIAKKLGVQQVTKAESPQASILNALNQQYSVLYDEDENLMTGRQAALDRLKISAEFNELDSVLLGSIEQVVTELPKLVQMGKHRYVVAQLDNQWIVYSADCPHLLGPLEGSEIDEQGRVTCPWHGYQFDVKTGKNCSRNSAGLSSPPTLSVVGDQLFLKPN